MSTKNSLQTEDPLTLEAVLEVKTGVVIGSLSTERIDQKIVIYAKDV